MPDTFSLMPTNLLTATLWIGAGAVVAAYVTSRASKMVKIAEHRQNWINALRDDISEYVTKADKIRRDTRDLLIAADEASRVALRAAIDENLATAEILLLKVRLRLNPEEADHVQLETQLIQLRDTQHGVELEDQAIAQARRVLRREWAVAKYGVFADFRLALKRVRRWCMRRGWELLARPFRYVGRRFSRRT